MNNIDRIVKVDIGLKTAPISQQGFNVILVVGAHVFGLTRVLTYSDPDDMLTDGFPSTDPIYKAVVKAFSQTPRPSEVKVGRRQVDGVDIVVDEVKAAAEYKIIIGYKDAQGGSASKTYTYTSDANDTAVDILTALAAAITGDAEAVINGTIAANTLQVVNKVSGTPYTVEISTNLSVDSYQLNAETIAGAMSAITAEDNDWYGWVLTSRTQADILAAAEWTEAQEKIFGTAINEAGAIDPAGTTDTGYKLKQSNYFRTFWFYHKEADTEYVEAAEMARCFAFDPGSETWANKQLAGVTADKITGTELNAIKGKNGNTFETFGSVSITQNGKVAAGEWIDIIRFRDWLKSDMQTRVFRQLVVNPKIPYTDGGISIIENEIVASLKAGQGTGGIAPTEYDTEGNEISGFSVQVPRSSEVSDNDKAERTLKGIKWSARLAGAIHAVEISGSLAYSI